jgi:capsular polysaccharide biosynthesis protein
VEQIDLLHLFKYYFRHKFTIFLSVFVGLSLAVIFTYSIQIPLYRSEASIILVSANGTTQETVLLNNYIELYKSRRVLEPVIGENRLQLSYEQLAAATTASNSKNTGVIKVSTSTSNPDLSTKLVNSSIVSFEAQVKELYKVDNIQIIDSASKPTSPYNVNMPVQLAIGVLAGFVGMIIVLFFLYDLGFDGVYKSTRLAKPKAINAPSPKLKLMKPPLLQGIESLLNKNKKQMPEKSVTTMPVLKNKAKKNKRSK